MHEFSLCQSIVETVIAELEDHKHQKHRLLKTHIVVGNLRQIVPEYLQFAYETLTKNTLAQDSKLEIKNMPITGICKKCGLESELDIHNYNCKKCGSSELELTGGKELYLESLEVDEDE